MLHHPKTANLGRRDKEIKKKKKLLGLGTVDKI